MIRHVVMWKLHEFADGADKPTNALRVKRLLEDMLGKVAGLLAVEVGVNQMAGAQAFDLVYIANFESWEALASYHDHPLHVQVKELLNKVRSERVVADFEIEK